MHGMMENMMGWGPGMMIFMSIFWIAVLVLIIVAIIYMVRRLPGGGGEREAFRETPLDILKKRYARGEIDRNEFEEKKKSLG